MLGRIFGERKIEMFPQADGSYVAKTELLPKATNPSSLTSPACHSRNVTSPIASMPWRPRRCLTSSER